VGLSTEGESKSTGPVQVRKALPKDRSARRRLFPIRTKRQVRKKAIAALRLMARSFHHPASAVLNSPPMMRRWTAEWLLPP